MQHATSRDGTTLAYRTLGSGSRDVVFVHGWMTSGHVWDTLLDQLDLVDHRLIIPDLRGAGSSEPAESYELEDYAADVISVASDAGAEIFDLVGHSMGGAIAQLVAATYPTRLRTLTLLSPVPASGMELPDEAHELFYHSGEDREA